jgi:hypothetical protein
MDARQREIMERWIEERANRGIDTTGYIYDDTPKGPPMTVAPSKNGIPGNQNELIGSWQFNPLNSTIVNKITGQVVPVP